MEKQTEGKVILLPPKLMETIIIKFVQASKFHDRLGEGVVRAVQVVLPDSVEIPGTNEVVKVQLVEVVSYDNGGQLGAKELNKPDGAVGRGSGFKPKSA